MAALTKLSNRAVRSTIFTIMEKMSESDRSNPAKIADAIKAEGFKPPSESTLKKNQQHFFAANPLGIKSAPSLNGNTTGFGADENISLTELSNIKGMIKRFGLEKFKQIIDLL